MRAKIECWILVLILAGAYAASVPGLWRQGSAGLPALLIGAVIFSICIALLFHTSAGAALLLAALAWLSAAAQSLSLIGVSPHFRGVAQPSDLQTPAGMATAAIVGFLSLDLWAQWRKGRTSRSSERAW